MATTTTILAVDDDADVRAVAAAILAEAGFHVIEAESGEAAIAILAGDGRVDLLLTDIVMGGLNGLDLARQARALRPELKVLFVSGFWPYIATEVGAEELVEKPFKAATLLSAVRRALGREGG
jgi:CheY-like chemotaxis protein